MLAAGLSALVALPASGFVIPCGVCPKKRAAATGKQNLVSGLLQAAASIPARGAPQKIHRKLLHNQWFSNKTSI